MQGPGINDVQSLRCFDDTVYRALRARVNYFYERTQPSSNCQRRASRLQATCSQADLSWDLAPKIARCLPPKALPKDRITSAAMPACEYSSDRYSSFSEAADRRLGVVGSCDQQFLHHAGMALLKDNGRSLAYYRLSETPCADPEPGPAEIDGPADIEVADLAFAQFGPPPNRNRSGDQHDPTGTGLVYSRPQQFFRRGVRDRIYHADLESDPVVIGQHVFPTLPDNELADMLASGGNPWQIAQQFGAHDLRDRHLGHLTASQATRAISGSLAV